MEIELKYGDGRKLIRIPDRADVTILKPAEFPAVGSITDTLEKVLLDPLGCDCFQSMLRAMGYLRYRSSKNGVFS